MPTNLSSSKQIKTGFKPLPHISLPTHDLKTTKTVQQKSAIILKNKGVNKKLVPDDIIMIVADSNYSTIYTKAGQQILTSKTLKVWFEALSNVIDFVRPHRSYLVNTRYILACRSYSRTLVITGNVEMPVCRRFKIKQLKSQALPINKPYDQ